MCVLSKFVITPYFCGYFVWVSWNWSQYSISNLCHDWLLGL